MEGILAALFLTVFVGSAWGGIVLARKWVEEPLARLFLGIALFVAFMTAGTIAIVSGCSNF